MSLQKEKHFAIRRAKIEATMPKRRLIEILTGLENAEAEKEAEKLKKIIIRLETWQNTGVR
jgi:hypothetical protein